MCSGSEAGSYLRLIDFVARVQEELVISPAEQRDYWSRTFYEPCLRSCSPRQRLLLPREREFFIDNKLVRIHFIIVMIRWTGLAPREFEFPFPGSLTSTFIWGQEVRRAGAAGECAGRCRGHALPGLHLRPARPGPTIQGYLAHKTPPPSPRTTLGP